MKIAIIGSGFTGLTAALRLLEAGHQVIVLEKETEVGGLAGGFKERNWQWTLEKTYHHWFTNDYSALNLAKKLNYPVIIKRPITNVLIHNLTLPFDSPTALIKFPYLSLPERLRTGLVTLYLKMINNHRPLEDKKALPWVRKYMGKNVTDLIWEPLFKGKFADFKEEIALTWFWARIKKRTPSLAYPTGGFLTFANKLAEKVKSLGGEILLNTDVLEIKNNGVNCTVVINSASNRKSAKINREIQSSTTIYADKIIATIPSPVFVKITSQLPKKYVQRISSISHLYAQNLILMLNKPFIKNSYWLNITQKEFPFLVLAEHTNFMDKKHYDNQHILYIGNYLPENHPFLKMTSQELLKIFDPFLKRINPDYQSSLVKHRLFSSPFAQPIVTIQYPKLIPSMETPLDNIYLANLDMVYPWDRGTNYAIELGEKIAELIVKS